MKINDITPLILTYNEEANIRRCLERLDWAQEILVVDHNSTDGTVAICAKFPRVRILQKTFSSLADQANFGLFQIRTLWTLSLDADYILAPDFEHALVSFDATNLNGASVFFTYCVFGKPLRGTLYPPRTVLHRTQDVHYIQDGHAHRAVVPGKIGKLTAGINHDDRKPLARWFSSQSHYAHLEVEKLLSKDPQMLLCPDRVRLKVWISPWLIVFWCLLIKRCIFDGRAGLYYTFQRMIAEAMLSVYLLDARLRGENR